ncbi:hypothetical protein B0H17DRAFT_1080486, partial [Mycena rosella]
MPAQPTETCENCTENHIDLRRCAGCSVSKECQKAHWKAYKPYCVSNAELARQAAELGPDYSDSLTAIGKCALNLMNYPERMEQPIAEPRQTVPCFDFLGPSAKAPHTHDIVDADVLPLDALLAHARGILLDKAAIFERNLAPRPRMIRVLLRDRRFPWSYTTPFVFEHLQMCVTRPGRPP